MTAKDTFQRYIVFGNMYMWSIWVNQKKRNQRNPLVIHFPFMPHEFLLFFRFLPVEYLTITRRVLLTKYSCPFRFVKTKTEANRILNMKMTSPWRCDNSKLTTTSNQPPEPIREMSFRQMGCIVMQMVNNRHKTRNQASSIPSKFNYSQSIWVRWKWEITARGMENWDSSWDHPEPEITINHH